MRCFQADGHLAFGCVLYESLAGRRAFQADMVSGTLAKVLEREPDLKALPAGTPAKVQNLLQKYLEKDGNRHLRDIGEGRMELLGALTDTTREDISSDERFKVIRRAAIGGLAGAAVAAGVGGAVWYYWPSPPKPVMRLSMDVSPAQQFAGFTPTRHLQDSEYTAMLAYSSDITWKLVTPRDAA